MKNSNRNLEAIQLTDSLRNLKKGSEIIIMYTNSGKKVYGVFNRYIEDEGRIGICLDWVSEGSIKASNEEIAKRMGFSSRLYWVEESMEISILKKQ